VSSPKGRGRGDDAAFRKVSVLLTRGPQNVRDDRSGAYKSLVLADRLVSATCVVLGSRLQAECRRRAD
jgi:hypothetical protein